MNQYKAFANKHGLTIKCKGVNSRPDSNFDASNMCHFNVSLFMQKPHESNEYENPKNLVWQGFYSMGFAHAESWAKKNTRRIHSWSTRNVLIHPLPYGKRMRDDSEYCIDVKRAFTKYGCPKIEDILLSLQMDAQYCDVPFNEWARDLGYSDDSINAHKIWNDCNDIRRSLNNYMPESFWKLQE